MSHEGRFQLDEQDRLDYGFFDGELPADLLAEFPVSQPEEPKILRSPFSDTHHRSASRRYPEHRSERSGSQPRSSRDGASYAASGVGTPPVDGFETKVFAKSLRGFVRALQC